MPTCIRFRGIALLAFAWCFLGVAPACQAAQEKTKRPNFVFILVDDLRWNALGCMGDKIVKTPNIDKLAARGVIFDNAFVTTSICAVSRASILTGQWQRRHGINNFALGLNGDAWAKTYPALLRAAGYRTGFIGKFGVGSAAEVGKKADFFDYWRGLPGQGGTFFIDKNDPTRTHKTAQMGNEALEFLKGCKPDTPFCLSISFNAVHARDGQAREYEPDPRDEDLYADVEIPIPKLATQEAFERLPEFVKTSEARRRWKARFANPEMFQKTLRDYYRLITGVDREVGRIVAGLAEQGLTDNTIIFFTADNGYFLGDRGLADKWFLYEESVRVSCIVCDPRATSGKAAPSPPTPLPKTERGGKEKAMVLNVDFAPTMLDMAGVPVPKTMQGRSLAPILSGKTPADWRTEFFYEHHTAAKIIPQSEGVRSERWSYIRWIAAEPVVEELYDLTKDALQERNLAADAAHAKTLAEMRGKWQKWSQGLK
jgi:arylsulfatase A-like enzyme